MTRSSLGSPSSGASASRRSTTGNRSAAQRVEVADVGAAAVHRLGHLGQRPFEHARHVEEPPRPRVAVAQQPDERGGVGGVPRQLGGAMVAEPVEQLVGRAVPSSP